MGDLSAFSRECFEQCPGLHNCVNETALRIASGEEIRLIDVITEHQDNGTLPQTCEKGPVYRGTSSLSSHALKNEVAVSAIVTVDAWGDLASIRCRAQGDVGGGSIRAVN